MSLAYWYCFCILLLGQTFGVLICTWFHANSSGRKIKWDEIIILWGNYKRCKDEGSKVPKIRNGKIRNGKVRKGKIRIGKLSKGKIRKGKIRNGK